MFGETADCPQLHANSPAEAADKELIMTEWHRAVSTELPDAVSKWKEK